MTDYSSGRFWLIVTVTMYSHLLEKTLRTSPMIGDWILVFIQAPVVARSTSWIKIINDSTWPSHNTDTNNITPIFCACMACAYVCVCVPSEVVLQPIWCEYLEQMGQNDTQTNDKTTFRSRSCERRTSSHWIYLPVRPCLCVCVCVRLSVCASVFFWRLAINSLCTLCYLTFRTVLEVKNKVLMCRATWDTKTNTRTHTNKHTHTHGRGLV